MLILDRTKRFKQIL